jgi:5'-3' exonuclease
MGIKNYKNSLLKTFPNIITRKVPKDIHTLCIDLNSILHKVCPRSNNNIDFKKNLINSINKIIKKIKPKKRLAIFTDGQAVLAKAKLQIKRRNKHLYSTSSGISSLNLTPCTPFMVSLDKIILTYLASLSIDTYYSSSKKNNEGELKLFNWLHNNNINDTTCIVGSDSDLIVLAVANSPLINMYIYNDKSFISIFKLVENLSYFVPSKFNLKWHPVRQDFVLMSLFQGNDYNKRISNFDKLLNAYSKLQKKKEGFLINKNKVINLKSVKKLLQKINVTNKKPCSVIDVCNYFESLQWNLNLYYNKINSQYIPSYNNINIYSILKYIPNKVNIINPNDNWLNWKVYLLLLMPIVGKKLVPNEIKKLMDEDSSIKDLFPEPCLQCIDWKKKLSQLIPPDNNADDEVVKKYREFSSKINCAYSNHIQKSHIIKDLPIQRIQEAVSKI